MSQSTKSLDQAHVVVIDDRPEALVLAEAEIGPHCKRITLCNPAQGRKILAEQGEDVDLAIVDYRLGSEGNGLGLLGELRAPPRFVLWTGSADRDSFAKFTTSAVTENGAAIGSACLKFRSKLLSHARAALREDEVSSDERARILKNLPAADFPLADPTIRQAVVGVAAQLLKGLILKLEDGIETLRTEHGAAAWAGWEEAAAHIENKIASLKKLSHAEQLTGESPDETDNNLHTVINTIGLMNCQSLEPPKNYSGADKSAINKLIRSLEKARMEFFDSIAQELKTLRDELKASFKFDEKMREIFGDHLEEDGVYYTRRNEFGGKVVMPDKNHKISGLFTAIADTLNGVNYHVSIRYFPADETDRLTADLRERINWGSGYQVLVTVIELEEPRRPAWEHLNDTPAILIAELAREGLVYCDPTQCIPDLEYHESFEFFVKAAELDEKVISGERQRAAAIAALNVTEKAQLKSYSTGEFKAYEASTPEFTCMVLGQEPKRLATMGGDACAVLYNGSWIISSSNGHGAADTRIAIYLRDVLGLDAGQALGIASNSVRIKIGHQCATLQCPVPEAEDSFSQLLTGLGFAKFDIDANQFKSRFKVKLEELK